MQDYKKLKVWAKAHSLALSIYQASSGFPKEELYGLTSQIRRACISIPSNIAEGCSKEKADFVRFLQIALGSTHELEYQIILAKDLSFLNSHDYDIVNSLINEVKGMLINLMKKVKTQ